MRGVLAIAGSVAVMAASAIAAPQAALAANVRTIEGYTAGGKLDWDTREIFQGAYCSADSGNTCKTVEYLSGAPLVGEFSGLTALTVALWVAPSPTTVVGFSQGSVIATEWIRGNEGRWGAPAAEDLSFVLVANPLRKYGGVRPIYDIDDPTPDSRYGILDIAVEYDGVADLPDNLFNVLAFANALAGAQHVHIYGYSEVDLENAEKLVWQEGNTTYVLIRNENIPLLQPLRDLGLGTLADLINDPLKAIIDAGYDRNYSGLVDPSDHAEALQQFSSLEDGPVAAATVADDPSSAVVESPQRAEPNLPDAAGSSQTPESSEPATVELTAEDPAAADPTAVDSTAEDSTALDSAAEDSAAEDSTSWDQAATEADEQSVDGETATSTADVDADVDADVGADVDADVDIESAIESEEDDTAPNAERSDNGGDSGSESTSDSDETGSSRGGDADGQDSASADPSGESGTTSESSAE